MTKKSKVPSAKGQPDTSGTDSNWCKDLPKSICYRAALIREKANLRLLCGFLAFGLLTIFVSSRIEISTLHKQLRTKEYILAPGVSSFVKAKPQSVPDEYVRDAVADIISRLGDVSADSIDDRYRRLARMMAPNLRSRFESESRGWVARIAAEGISETLSPIKTKIIANGSGGYKVEVKCRRRTWVDTSFAGEQIEVIVMTLRLIPPNEARRWFLQISDLRRMDRKTFKKIQRSGTEN